ncbi:hypothetical protein ACIOJF_03685 [Glutamicibacter sp. NPDC087831]|uniref:hypothetical protein n=1 Tax=Glutamicibacter sp. NPDC087831 TaxID=3363998 RepID=UPI003829808B
MTTNQPPLNPDAIEAGAKALFLRERKYHTPSIECPEPPNWEDLTETSMEHYRGNARAVLAVAQPVVNSVEELDALPHGTVIMATGGRWNPGHPELFLKCGYAHAPWMALDPSDRDDGENLESSGAVLRWRCDGEARVLYRPVDG